MNCKNGKQDASASPFFQILDISSTTEIKIVGTKWERERERKKNYLLTAATNTENLHSPNPPHLQKQKKTSIRTRIRKIELEYKRAKLLTFFYTAYRESLGKARRSNGICPRNWCSSTELHFHENCWLFDLIFDYLKRNWNCKRSPFFVGRA